MLLQFQIEVDAQKITFSTYQTLLITSGTCSLTMAAVLTPPVVALLGDYSPAHFQSLPTLETAKDNFLVRAKGNEVATETIREFFVNEGMERTFGLAMLHRHFDLEANERLVDYQGTSTPWQATVTGMRDPQAAIWAFDKDDVLRPTEFRYSETVDAPLPENAPDFIRKFNAFLKQLNMVNVLGLARYPGDDFQGSCEITHGRANINLKPEDVR